jgi:hypothetical protein
VPLAVLLMSDPLRGLPPGPVSSTSPLPAATSVGFELPEEPAAGAAPLSPLPEAVPEPLPSPSVPVAPPSIPDAKSTFGNEQE